MTLSGTTANASGSAFYLGNSTLSTSTGGTTLAIASGNLTLTGSTTNGGYGFRNLGTLALTNGTGTSTISGTSTANNAIYLSVATIINAGSLTIAGNATTSGNAVYLSSNGASTQSFTNTGSTFAINGTSSSGNGLKILSGTVATAGGVVLSGTSITGSGVLFNGSNALNLTSGALTLSGATSSASKVGLDLSSSGNTITNSGSGLLSVSGTGGDKLAATISSASGNVVISDTGTVTQSAGSITAGNLLLSGTGTFLLIQSNAVTTLAASAGAVTFYNGQSLGIGTVQGTAGVTTTGTPIVNVTSGNLTIAASTQVSGVTPILAAASAFVNNGGSSAVVASSGSWQIYSANSAGDTFGNLNSGNAAIWNTTYSGTSNPASGNRYLFATQPTLTFTSTSTSKVYGTDDTSTVASRYTISGYQPMIANAYLADTASTVYSGTPSVTSTATGTGGAVGSYQITAAAGSVTALSGYAFSYASSGTLTVTAAPLTITANNQSKVYGSTFSFAGTEFTSAGLQNGETIGSVGLTSAGSVTTASVAGGPYAITPSAATGGSFTAGNYSIGYVAGAMTVTQAALTVTANAQSRAYGAANPTLSYVVGGSGLLNGDTLSGLLATAATATSSVAGSPYAITQGTLAASANYTLAYTGANLAVTPATLTVTAANQSKVYGSTFSFAGTEFTSAGLQNGETIGSVGLTSAGSVATASVAGGPYAITPSAATGGSFTAGNYSIGYVAGAMTVTQAALTVTANAQSRAYGAANPTLSYVVGGSGLLNGDTLSGLLATTATATSSVAGSPYAITQGTLAASANYTLAYTGANLAVTPATLTVTAANQSKVYGSTFSFAGTEFTSAGLQNGETIGSVGLTSAGSVATASVAGGPYAITPSAATGGSFTAGNYSIGYVAGAMTVTQAALTVTANAQSRAYGAANPTLSYVVGGSGLLNGDTLSGLLATTATATSSVAGSPYAITQGTLAASANYTLAYTGANLAVTPATLTVTAANQSKVYGSTFTFAGTEFTSAGLQNGETIGSVGLTSAGSVTTASVAGGPYAITPSAATGGSFTAGNYSIGYVAGAMTVTQAQLTETATAANRLYGGATPALTGSLSGFATGDNQGNSTTGTLVFATPAVVTDNVGSYAINGSGLTSANYSIVQAGTNATALTIAQAPATVTGSKVYDATTGFVVAQLAIAGGVNGETLSLSAGTGTAASPNVGTASGSLAGLALTVTGGNALASNYLLPTAGQLSITQAQLTETATAANRLYGGATPALTGSLSGFATGDNQGNATTGTLVFATPAVVTDNVGSYAINGSGLTSANYSIVQAGTNATALTIAQAPATVTGSKVYDATTGFVVAQLAIAGGVNGETLSLSAGTGTAASPNVGTASGSLAGLALTVTGGNALASNYLLPTAGQLSITQAALTVTANAQSRAYGAANPTLSYVVGGSGLLNGDTLSGLLATAATATSSVAGSPYAITQGTLAASANYTLAYTGANLAVTPATLTVTAANQSKVYGSTFSFAGTEFTSAGLQNGETIGSVGLTSAGSVATASVAGGPYAITPSAATGGSFTAGNYSIGYVAGAMTVTQAALTVTANAQSRAYGAANPTLSYVVGGSGLLNGDTLSGLLATAATATSSVAGSPYAITQGTLAASANYTLAYTGANLAVTPATLTVTAANQSKVYGSTFSFAGTEFTSAGLQNGETIGSVGLTSAGSVATASVAGGPYAITPSAATGGSFTAGNYSIGYVAGAMTVTQAALTVTANAQSRAYGAANPTLSYVVGGSGLLNGDTLSGLLATTATATSSVAGSPYAITQGTLAASANYTLAYTGANLAVTPATLTVTAANQSKVYGSTFSFAGTEFTSAGLQNGETIGSVGLTSAGSVATASVAGGPYAITPSAATGGSFTAGNYSIGYVAGAMTVTQAALTVTANAQSRAYGAANPTLSYVVGGSGLLNGDTLSGLLATTATATSSVAGSPYAITQGTLAASANYTLAYTGANLAVTPATLTVTAANQSKVYGSTFTFAGTEFTSAGLQNGETIGSVGLTSAGSVTTASVAGGPYAITPSAATGGSFTAGNYSIGYVAGAMTVTQAQLTETATAANRLYGGATPALTGSLSGFATGDNQGNATTGTLVFATPAVVTDNVGSYAINGSGLTSANYSIVQAGTNATALTIAQAPATVTGSKVYDATTGFVVAQLAIAGGVNGETLSLSAGTGTAASPNVGTASGSLAGLALTVTGGNALASNYLLPTVGQLSITQAQLTETATAANRLYGGATPALTGSLSGFATGDNQGNATTGTLVFATPAVVTDNVGSYAINGSGLTSANYSIVQAGTNATALTIAQAPATVTGSKVYDATTGFVVAQLAIAGGVNGETLSLSAGTGTAASPNVGTASGSLAGLALTVTGGNALASNYLLPTAGQLSITQAQLTETATAANRLYGGATPALTGSLSGFATGDNQGNATTGTLVFATPAVVTDNVGSYAINGSGLTSANYSIVQAGTNATALTIAQAPATVTGSKVYDATTGFVVAQLAIAGGVNGETLSLSAGTGTAASPNVGTASGSLAGLALTVTGGNALASNYLLPTAGQLSITQAALTVTANAQSRAYGAANPTLSYVVGGSGLLNGDTLSGLLATAATATSSVAGSPYAITQGTLAASANYTLAYTGANLAVTPATLTVTAANQSKVYGSTFTFAGTEFTSAGLQNGETIGSVGLTSAGSVATASVAGGPYAITPSAATGGSFTAGNYSIGYATAPTGLTVSPAPITITAATNTRVYDSTTAAGAIPTVTGSVNNGDVSDLSESYASANVGTGLMLTPTATIANASNYAVSYVANTAGVITAAPITITAVTNTKIYDSTTAAAAIPTVTGTVYNGDVSHLAETYASANVGTGLTLTPTGTIANAGNYATSYVTNTTGVINAAAITSTIPSVIWLESVECPTIATACRKSPCQKLQTSARGIAVLGGPCPRSLQWTEGVRPTIIAPGRREAATGIVIMGVAPTPITPSGGSGRAGEGPVSDPWIIPSAPRRASGHSGRTAQHEQRLQLRLSRN